MSTFGKIGIGDIHAGNPSKLQIVAKKLTLVYTAERALSMVWMMIGSCLYAFIIASFAWFLSALNTR